MTTFADRSVWTSRMFRRYVEPIIPVLWPGAYLLSEGERSLSRVATELDYLGIDYRLVTTEAGTLGWASRLNRVSRLYGKPFHTLTVREREDDYYTEKRDAGLSPLLPAVFSMGYIDEQGSGLVELRLVDCPTLFAVVHRWRERHPLGSIELGKWAEGASWNRERGDEAENAFVAVRYEIVQAARPNVWREYPPRPTVERFRPTVQQTELWEERPTTTFVPRR